MYIYIYICVCVCVCVCECVCVCLCLCVCVCVCVCICVCVYIYTLILTQSEIEQILQLGISPTRIIYANPCKQISYLEYAKQNNVDLTTFDDEYELYKVKEVYPDVR